MPSFATRGSIFTMNDSVFVTPPAVSRALYVPGAHQRSAAAESAALHVAAADGGPPA